MLVDFEVLKMTRVNVPSVPSAGDVSGCRWSLSPFGQGCSLSVVAVAAVLLPLVATAAANVCDCLAIEESHKESE